MHSVFEKASALGEAIQQSEEFRAMRAAENAVTQDEQAAAVMGEFLSRKGQVEDILSSEEPDHAALAEHSQAMETLQETLQAMPLVQTMARARADFAAMMQQMNQVLRFMVTGEMPEEDEDGCSGNCGGCAGGCGHRHLQ